MPTLYSGTKNPIPDLEKEFGSVGVNADYFGFFSNRNIFPLCRSGIYSGDIGFFIVKKSVIDHYLGYKKSILQFNDYSVLQEVFSEEDLISIFSLNLNFGFLKLNENNSPSEHVGSGFNRVGFFINLDKKSPHWNKFNKVIMVGASAVANKTAEKKQTTTDTKPISNEVIFEFHKVSDSNYNSFNGNTSSNYLIVIDDLTIGALGVRGNLLKLVSECLKVQNKYSSIEDVAKSDLYRVYLALLKYKQDGIEYI